MSKSTHQSKELITIDQSEIKLLAFRSYLPWSWSGIVLFSRCDHMMHSALSFSSSAMMLVDTRRRRLTVCNILLYCLKVKLVQEHNFSNTVDWGFGDHLFSGTMSFEVKSFSSALPPQMLSVTVGLENTLAPRQFSTGMI